MRAIRRRYKVRSLELCLLRLRAAISEREHLTAEIAEATSMSENLIGTYRTEKEFRCRPMKIARLESMCQAVANRQKQWGRPFLDQLLGKPYVYCMPTREQAERFGRERFAPAEKKPEPWVYCGFTVPEGYDFAAVDRDGAAFAYKKKPIVGSIGDWEPGIPNEGFVDLGKLSPAYFGEGWKLSLECRPDTKPSEPFMSIPEAHDIPWKPWQNFWAVDADGSYWRYVREPKRIGTASSWSCFPSMEDRRDTPISEQVATVRLPNPWTASSGPRPADAKVEP